MKLMPKDMQNLLEENSGSEEGASLTPEQERMATLLRAASTLRWDYPEQATILYGKAAILGNTDAMIEFGHRIQDDDPELASYWFEKAVASGDTDAFYAFIELWREKDQSRVTDPMERILSTKDSALIYGTACSLEEVNINAAIEMLQVATDLGDDSAPHELGKLLLKKTKKNRDEALCLFELAAERGEDDALFDLAKMIEDEDPMRAADLYEKVMGDKPDDLSCPWAAARLARLVKDSDPDRALSFYEGMMRAICKQSKNDYANEIEPLDPEKAQALYKDVAVVEVEDLGFEYCGIPSKRSGLPVKLLASDVGSVRNDEYNPPHVLVANSRDRKCDVIGEGFKASISKDPQVLEGENRLSDEDWAAVRQFISDNYDALFDHWIHAHEQGSADLYDNLFPEDYAEFKARRAQEEEEALQVLEPDDSLNALMDAMWKEAENEH